MPKKTHHNPDYVKNKTADVIPHGNGEVIPQAHWEVNRNLTPAGSDTGPGAFLPREGKNRRQNYVKTNECDH